jgi:6-phosphogluconolactonase
MKGLTLRWHVYGNAAKVAAAAAGMIEFEAAGAIATRGRFTIVLAGGRTPVPIYARLTRYTTDWSRWYVFFSDERCLPAGHPERNETMARDAWLDHVPIPREQIHPIPTERGATAAVEAYHRILTAEPPFDLTLLGLGADGHTASLFPGHALAGTPAALDVLAVHDAPKPPAQRVSLSIARLSRSDRIAVLALGADKRKAVRRLRFDEDLPIHQMTPRSGIDVFVDRAAAGA